MTARAFRNNNPGNINAGEQWQGLMPRSQMTPEQAAEDRFAVFAAPKWGFRALAIVLKNYEVKYGLDTVRKVISRWAPPSENNTDAYVQAVASALGKGPDDHIDLHDPKTLEALAKAIAIHESGGWLFADTDLVAGVAMAEL
jgi:hypothetical protein